jgi:hypothetical protein
MSNSSSAASSIQKLNDIENVSLNRKRQISDVEEGKIQA